jgi:hypothetical protein
MYKKACSFEQAFFVLPKLVTVQESSGDYSFLKDAS